MPRSLAAAARPYVDSRSRSRGEAYFLAGHVTVVYADEFSVSAVVRGTEKYDVTLRLDENALLVQCSCPYFLDTDQPCKHVWATIRAADRDNRLHVPPDLFLDTADPHEFDLLDVDDVDEDIQPRRLTPAARARISDRMKLRWADRSRGAAPACPAPPAPWRVFLERVAAPHAVQPPRTLFTGELIYVVDTERSVAAGGLHVEVMTRDRKKSGEWGKPKPLTINRGDVPELPDARDRDILDLMSGASHASGYSSQGWAAGSPIMPVPTTSVLSVTLQRELTPRLCETGRLLLRIPPSPLDSRAVAQLLPIAWDAAPSAFRLRITGDPQQGYTIGGVLLCDGRERPFTDALFVTSALILWGPDVPGDAMRVAAFETGGAGRWLARLLDAGAQAVTVPASESMALVEALVASDLADVECPEELRVRPASDPPHPILRITRGGGSYSQSYGRLDATLTFDYGGREVDAWAAEKVCFDRERRAAWRRDREAERAAIGRLQSMGVRRLADWQTGGTRLDFAETQLPTLTRVLLSEGWTVEAEGRLYRRAASMSFSVRSGVDWFELHGGVDFGGVEATIPALLAAGRRGDRFVALGDGTFGLVPDEWLARARRIGEIGTTEGDHVRFRTSQTALLDAWLASEPAVSCDQAFGRARAELARFDGIAPLDPPATFHGELRAYQRDALGWFDFLRRFGFGGCLADEMGLGKTVMVLAALDARRTARAPDGHRPSLIVMPRSLIFNWRQEASRFAPALRVLDYTGGTRKGELERIAAHDVVLTTYGTLRRDVGYLKEVAFDYAILDEAQAIKNAQTSAAKAARLLKAEHRLALSGTPIENHLGELWSLFEFLNPGLLGAAAPIPGRVDEAAIAMLARGLRPFILRRTKEQVAAELPARTEQTLYCDLEPAQRALYDELRDHYRAVLLGKVARDGIGRAKLQVLEALLRLRQAACHPGLVDPARGPDPSAKLDMLVPRLQELVEDGRKVLVFSQFTSLLALLRARLDEARLAYEYLDGKTRDRERRVMRFQQDDCPLFLISLKAGGLGLNLTAAEYVFLLDPWWNPAVEAQAIDRAHRIGQTRPVFAFRLIARDTVEEKVLELQASKRQLADAIVRADASLIRDLRREDLELLLS